MHFIFELLMDLFVEFVVDGLIELSKKIFELVARLFRSAGRFVRWIIEQRRQRRGMIYFSTGKSAHEATGAPRIFSPSRRRRERRRKTSYEVG
jgi:hypothetical protein